MFWVGVFTVLAPLMFASGVPTVYRMKDNHILEADLVPVSSTVIPIEVYKLGTTLNVTNPHKKHKVILNGPVGGETYKKFYYGKQKKEEVDLN